MPKDPNFAVALVTGAAEDTNAAQGPLADPKDVARDGYEAPMKGEVRVVSGLTNKVQAMLSNITPDSLVAAGMRKMFEEKKQPFAEVLC